MHTSEEDDEGHGSANLLRRAKHRDVDPLRKLMLTGGRADSSSRFQNFKGVFNPRNFWIGWQQLRKFSTSRRYLKIGEFL
jgi:hypothetical protein